MLDWLKAQALASPGLTALIHTSSVWSYADLDVRVDHFCSLLAGQNLAQGDRLATLLPAVPEHVCLVYAAARLGLVLIPLNLRLTAAELAPQIQHAHPVLLVGDNPDRLAPLAGTGCRALTLNQLRAFSPQPFSPALFNLENVQGILFTSGTSGNARGVTLTFASHFWSALASAARIGMSPVDRWLSPLPLYHVGGLATLFRCTLAAAAVILSDTDAGTLVSHLERGATLVSLVPTLLRRLLDQGPWQAPALRLILLGGAAADPDLLAEAQARSLPVAPTYGLTEAASQVATLPPEQARLKPGSVGRPLLYNNVRIVDANQQECLPGVPGEILVSGPTLMQGYDSDPAATRQVIYDGWLHTNDIGYLDTDGDLWVLQRRIDLILSGGENIYPSEIERVLRSHPSIADAIVVGLPDAHWGQVVSALLILKPGRQPLSLPELHAHCRKDLAGYKLPRRMAYTRSFPLTATGKISRPQVRQILLAESGEPEKSDAHD
jgi:O-succinylbenzoic acid--CoA ligase